MPLLRLRSVHEHHVPGGAVAHGLAASPADLGPRDSALARDRVQHRHRFSRLRAALASAALDAALGSAALAAATLLAAAAASTALRATTAAAAAAALAAAALAATT